jgi:DNA-binding transcriptional LysR family regulator
MDKLSAMLTFVRVVESGSFSAVANERNTTQSAISKQIASLETALNSKLLIRTTRSLALTEEGERYFEQVRRLVSEIAEVESALHIGQSQLKGWLRVAASVGFGRLKLMPLVKSFMAIHPDVKIDMHLNDGFIDLVEHGIDVAVRIGELPDSGLIARRIGTSQRMLLAHQSYLKSLRPDQPLPIQPDDLLNHECIVYTGLSNSQLWAFTSIEAEDPRTTKSVRIQGSLQTNSSEAIRYAVNSGMGIGYSPTWLFEDELTNGEVVRLMPGWESPQSPIHLVCPPERKHSAKVKAFMEHITSFISEKQTVATAEKLMEKI